jgi:hypothetical protein
MTTSQTSRTRSSRDRARRLFSELEHAQRRLLEMQLGVPSTPGPQRTGMLSQYER